MAWRSGGTSNDEMVANLKRKFCDVLGTQLFCSGELRIMEQILCRRRGTGIRMEIRNNFAGIIDAGRFVRWDLSTPRDI